MKINFLYNLFIEPPGEDIKRIFEKKERNWITKYKVHIKKK